MNKSVPLGTYRFALAIMVMLGHFIAAFLPDVYSALPHPIGTVGVLSFFVVSGYVISEAAVTHYADKPWGFAANRGLRIFPPYYAALAVAILVGLILWVATGSTPVSAACLLWNIGIAPLDWRIVDAAEPCFVMVRYMWAIVVELQFYLAAFLILLVRPFVALGRATAIAIIIMAVAYAINVAIPVYHGLSYTPYFIAGVLVFAWRNQPGHHALAAILGLACLADCYLTKVPASLQPGATTAIMGLSLLVFYVLLMNRGKSWWGDKLLRDLTYPVYLNHYSLELLFATIVGVGVLSFGAAIVLSIAVSVAAFFVIEPHTKALRDRIRGARLDGPSNQVQATNSTTSIHELSVSP